MIHRNVHDQASRPRRRHGIRCVALFALIFVAAPALGQGTVYWADFGAGAILRKAKDGSTAIEPVC